MNQRRLCRLLPLATFGLAAAFVASPPSPAGASTPSAVAWWYKVYPSSAPAAPPAPPQVPKGGLWVAEDPTGVASASPTPLPAPGSGLPVPVPAPVPSPPVQPAGPLAFATVRAALGAGSGATITLKVAAGSTAQLASIDACPVSSPGSWQASPDGGPSPMDKAPTFDCSAAVPGKLAPDSSTLTWELPASMQGSDGTVDVALVPHTGGATPPAPFEVAFEPPDASTVSGPAAAPTPTPQPFAPSPSAAAVTPAATATLPSSSPTEAALGSGSTFGGGAATAPAAASLAQPAAASAPASASQPLAVTPVQAVPVSLFNDHRGQRLMAVSILLLLAVAWWWVGGQPGRGPRLLGRAHGATSAVTAVAAVRLRGVGRFVRPRTAPARRLIG